LRLVVVLVDAAADKQHNAGIEELLFMPPSLQIVMSKSILLYP